MAKMTRTALKNIVKECLVEILAEGLAPGDASRNSGVSALTENKKRTRSKTRANKTLRPALDHIQINPELDQLPDTVQSYIKNSDSVMSDIFADTAANTLTEQMTADRDKTFSSRVSQGDTATKKMASSDPLEMFEGAGNWAALAFSSDAKDR